MQKPRLGKIKLLSAKEQVAAVLRKAILSRDLVEGQEITLEGIASMVGVSSMPVREAFQILAADGLINEQTIREHYEIRALLESEAVAKASHPGTDISRIAEVHYSAEKALAENNSAEYSDMNQAFHMEIWNAAGNAKMKLLLSNMWNGLSMGHKVTEEEYASISIREHKGILQALELHDEELARLRMREHIIRSMENMLTRYVDDPGA